MRKLLLTLAFLLAPSWAWAQCTGVFPANTLCGNLSGSPQPPAAFSATGTIVGATPTTSGDLVTWGNTAGTLATDTSTFTTSQLGTWNQNQTWTASRNNFSGSVSASTLNITNTLLYLGNAMTLPSVAATIPGLGITNIFTSQNTLTQTVSIGTLSLTNALSSAYGGVNPTFVTSQTFTISQASTYNTPFGVKWLKVKGVGGGGGGGGVGTTTTTSGGTGGTTAFGTMSAAGGAGGGYAAGGTVITNGGVGGTATLGGGGAGSAVTGGPGEVGNGNVASGRGGASCIGGGGIAAINATSGAAAPTGGGGGGGFNSGNGAGGGGGAGGCFDAVIINPATSYAITLGASGAAGVGTGTGAQGGGAGGGGFLYVEEHYNY